MSNEKLKHCFFLFRLQHGTILLSVLSNGFECNQFLHIVPPRVIMRNPFGTTIQEWLVELTLV